MHYKYKTECPRCNKVDTVEVDRANPRMHCGDCLMQYTELVPLICTQLEVRHD